MLLELSNKSLPRSVWGDSFHIFCSSMFIVAFFEVFIEFVTILHLLSILWLVGLEDVGS